MRVAQVVGKLAAGGVEAVVNTYYRRLDHTRIQFDYFIDEDSPCDPPEKLIALGARYFRIPPTTRPLARILTLRRIFAQNHYPIVHAHMTTLNLPVLLAARWAGVPVRICHAHSTSAPGEGARGLLKRLLRPTARLFATHLMACGQATAQWMFPARLLATGRVTILPNAVDVSRFCFCEAVRVQARARLGWKMPWSSDTSGASCARRTTPFCWRSSLRCARAGRTPCSCWWATANCERMPKREPLRSA